jgi:hypothetical protein
MKEVKNTVDDVRFIITMMACPVLVAVDDVRFIITMMACPVLVAVWH